MNEAINNAKELSLGFDEIFHVVQYKNVYIVKSGKNLNKTDNVKISFFAGEIAM